MSGEMVSLPVLTHAEVDEICVPLKQSLAKVRFLERLGLKVARRPDGSPLVSRSEFERVMSRDASRSELNRGFNWSK